MIRFFAEKISKIHFSSQTPRKDPKRYGCVQEKNSAQMVVYKKKTLHHNFLLYTLFFTVETIFPVQVNFTCTKKVLINCARESGRNGRFLPKTWNISQNRPNLAARAKKWGQNEVPRNRHISQFSKPLVGYARGYTADQIEKCQNGRNGAILKERLLQKY